MVEAAAGSHSTSRRVLVVDDDEWRRRGLAAGIIELGGILELAGAVPVEALVDRPLTDVQTILLGVDQRFAEWDALSGIRALDVVDRADRPTTLAVGHDALDPILIVRAIEAGIDHLYDWTSIADPIRLEQALLVPELARRPGRLVQHESLRVLGLTCDSRLTAGLRWLEAEGLEATMTSGGTGRLTRRQAITVRNRLSCIMKITAPAQPSGLPPRSSIPTWAHLTRLVDIARGAIPANQQTTGRRAVQRVG